MNKLRVVINHAYAAISAATLSSGEQMLHDYTTPDGFFAYLADANWVMESARMTLPGIVEYLWEREYTLKEKLEAVARKMDRMGPGDDILDVAYAFGVVADEDINDYDIEYSSQFIAIIIRKWLDADM